MSLLDDLKLSVEWTLSPEQERIAQWAINSLSLEAAYLASVAWTTPEPPPIIGLQVVKAASRWVRNPDGLSQDRVGDMTIGRPYGSVEIHSSPTFTPDEAKLIKSYSGATTASPSFSVAQGVGLVLNGRSDSLGGEWSL